MNIGITKLNCDVNDIKNTSADKNGRYKEILTLITSFSAAGYQCELTGVFDLKYYNVIYVLNGVLDTDETYIEQLKQLKKRCNSLNYILTDLRLINTEISKICDCVLTQSTENIPFIYSKQLYNGMPELAATCAENTRSFEKEELFIFGGGIRDRVEDFNEYLLNQPTFNLFYKSIDGSVDTRLPIDEYYNQLNKSKYTLVINDIQYNKYGFITWRYYESIARNVITFLDYKVDKNKIIKLPEWVRKFVTVKSRDELLHRMKLINMNKCLYLDILDEQTQLLTPDVVSGRFTVNCLLASLERSHPSGCDMNGVI